jgi:2-oxoisovalerate dehydrogenase E1 component beta subunit
LEEFLTMANMAQAIRMALHFGEENLGVKDIFGQDVGPPLGGVFTATQGLKNTWNSPLDERGIIGTAMGLAMAGSRCVAEIQFADYIFNTIDLLKIAGNTCWSSYGQFPMPMTVMTPVGSGIRGSIYHSHSFDAWATRLPGWKILMPSNSLDAYGLLLAAMKDPNPVLFLPPKALIRVKGEELIPGEPADEKELRSMIDAPLGDRSQWKPRWPDVQDYTVPIGKGKIVKEGRDATVVSYGRTLPLCKQAADEIEKQSGRSIEVIDLRSLYPYDWSLIKQSVQKTRKVLFVNEDTEVTNFGEHLVRRSVEEFFYILNARPRVLAGKNLPGIGLNPILEENTVPQLENIIHEMRELLGEVP